MKRIYTLISLFMAIFAMSANAQTWDFSGEGIPDVDIANLNADATNWNYDSANNRWGNLYAINDEELKANGKTLYFTEGLFFTASNTSEFVRIDAKKTCLTLNNSGTVVKIKNLKAGYKVTVKAQCSSKDTKRTINAKNVTSETFGKLEGVSGTILEFTGEVTADGDITLQATGGMYVHFISVVDPNAEPELDPSSLNKTTNSVFKNANNNQMQLTLANGDNFYYNTAELKAVNIDGKKVLVESAADGVEADYYDGTLSDIKFFKGKPTGAEAQDITNNAIVITEAKGWLESAYIKFTPISEAKSYNVYVKGGQFASYTKIDAQLVRNYGTYGRADMVGLPAGTYDMKIVAVNESGAEFGEASEATGMTVKAYDRRGFAHFNMTQEMGAYDKTGKLLPGAVVIYVTAKNAKTVQATVLYEGKMTTFTGLQSILDGYQKKGTKTPIAIRLIGKISKDDLDHISSGDEGLQIKAADNYGHMPITIEGIGDDATIHGFGLLIRNCGYVELRNFAVMSCMDDCVSMDTNNEHLWIHNLDLFYGQTGGDADQAKGDGTLDIKGNSRMTTMAYNHLFDSGKASLCGMGGDAEEYISYIGNWFDHSDSRHPRVRCMTVHVLNNYYDGVAKYGIGATTDSDIFVEGNYFRNTKYPMLISKQGSDVATDSKGTFSGEDGGMIKSYGNKIIGATRYVTYQQNNTQFDAYEAATREEKIPAEVKAVLGGATYNNFDTDASKIYSYEALAADDVPGEITGWTGAGRLGHGDFKWTFNNSVDDKSYDVNKALKTAVVNYQSSLVGFFGGETLNPGTGGGNEGGEGTGGSEGGEGTGGEGTGTTTPTSSIIDGPTSCNFVGKACSNPTQFTISGNYSNSNGSATYKGTTYSECLKMESSTSIKFKTAKDLKLILVFASAEVNKDRVVKVNGTAKKSDANGQVILDIPAGDYELTKGDKANLFFIDITE